MMINTEFDSRTGKRKNISVTLNLYNIDNIVYNVAKLPKIYTSS